MPPDGGDLLSSAWRWELVGISLGSLAGFRCFWGFRCVGELEVIMHLTSGAVQCRVLESLL